jgi:hypothetical protein
MNLMQFVFNEIEALVPPGVEAHLVYPAPDGRHAILFMFDSPPTPTLLFTLKNLVKIFADTHLPRHMIEHSFNPGEAYYKPTLISYILETK